MTKNKIQFIIEGLLGPVVILLLFFTSKSNIRATAAVFFATIFIWAAIAYLKTKNKWYIRDKKDFKKYDYFYLASIAILVFLIFIYKIKIEWAIAVLVVSYAIRFVFDFVNEFKNK